MKKCMLGVFAIGLLLAADDKKPDDPKEKLKGKWTFVSMTRDGKNVPDEPIKPESMTFEEEKVTIKGPQVVIEGDKAILKNVTKTIAFKLDASQKPAQLDFIGELGPDKTTKLIYQIDGDMLKIGAGMKVDGDRAKSFDDAYTVITLKREKK